eukprot:CCRYP_006175-RE/>CCRYP_006175-RE protein AED:0.39 eAED:0.39 QI:453/0/0.5/1/1/1/2/0/129
MNAAKKNTMDAPDSFAKRVNDALHGQFKPQMSHAVILLAVFEANRIQATERAIARPFQRKIAVLTAAIDLIYTLDFLTDDEKARLVSMTPQDKKCAKPIIARIAFHRAERLEEEVQSKILPGVEKMMGK